MARLPIAQDDSSNSVVTIAVLLKGLHRFFIPSIMTGIHPLQGSNKLSFARAGRTALRVCFLIVACVFLAGPRVVKAKDAEGKGPWIAPASQAQKKNPIPVSDSSLSAGRKIYLKRCAACHGKTGNGDGDDAIELGLHPAKFSDPRLRTEPDGALYWKITTGRKPMPDYGSRLSPDDRWNVINYLRTLTEK